jgi:hypothetical protein
MGSCLYRSDYGPPQVGFDPVAVARAEGYARHVDVFAAAKNPAQFEAVKRQLDRGEAVLWCDQGYGWVYNPAIEAGFIAVVIFLVFPVAILRASAKRAGNRSRHSFSNGLRDARPASRSR